MDVSYRTLCDPPAPTSAVKCRLPFSLTPCFAAATGNKLQIYTYQDSKLILLWEKCFWTKIVEVFQYPEGDYDSLILVCDISKVVVLKPVGGIDLQETEFHLFEPKKEMYDEHRTAVDDIPTCIRHPTKAVIDPKRTCIAMLVGQSTLFFLTLANPDGFDYNRRPQISEGQHSSWETINGAVSINLIELDKPLYRIRDIRFLDGYNRPTLAIMHELIPTWSVRLPVHRSTVAVSIMSPLLVERDSRELKDQTIQSISWTSRPLPHNSIKIIPVLPPDGGFIILTTNAIIYMTYTSGLAYGLNALARDDDECPFELCGQTTEPYEILTSSFCVMDQTHILLTVNENLPAILTLHNNGNTIVGMSLFVKTDFEFHSSLFLQYDGDIFFGGSTIEDSLLFQIKYDYQEEESTIIDTIELSQNELDLYRELYDSMPVEPPRQIITSIQIGVLSRIYQLGTVTCATPFINKHEAAFELHGDDAISMALGCGYRACGRLQYLRLGLTPNTKYEITNNVPETISIFASDAFNFALFSTPNSTLIYQISPDFKDITDQRKQIIVSNEMTIAAKDYGEWFVQVTPSGVRLFNNEEVLATYTSNSGKEIKQAVIYNNYIAIVVDQSVLLCTYFDHDSGSVLPFQQLHLQTTNQLMNKQAQIYKVSIYQDYLFALQTNNVLLIYSLRDHSLIQVYDQFRYFNDVYYKGSQFTASSPASVLLDMNIIDIGTSMPILTLLMKEGNIILYQIHILESGNQFSLRRIKTRRFTYHTRPNKHNAIIQFTDINGFTGGFICGDKPMFLIGENGYPRLVHAPSSIYFATHQKEIIFGDNRIVRFANFIFSQNVPLPNKFETHIIDGCVVQRQHLGQTPRFLTYAKAWNSLVLFASYPIPFSHEGEIDPEDIDPEAKLKPHYQKPLTPDRVLPEDVVYPTSYEEQYELYVIGDSGISKVLSLDKHEVGYCVSFIHVKEDYQNLNSSLNEYLAIGTGFMCTEERNVRGRLRIYKGSLVQSDQQDVNEYMLTELCKKVLKSPVTSICDVDGYIAAFVGAQLQILMFINEKHLKVASFLNAHFFSSQLISIKHYMIYVDAFKGFQMIRWREYGHKLISVAKDFQTFRPLSASLLIHGETFAGALYDCFGNVQIFEIDEYAVPSDAFKITSVFNIGCNAISAGQFPMRSTERADVIAGYFAWFVGETGKIGIFSPMKNDNTRRLLCYIQSLYEKTLVGFSHQEYRWGKFPLLMNHELINESPRLVADLDLLLDFLESQSDTQKGCLKVVDKTQFNISVAEISSVSTIFE